MTLTNTVVLTGSVTSGTPLPTRMCDKCWRAPAEVTHICPPLGMSTTAGSYGLGYHPAAQQQ